LFLLCFALLGGIKANGHSGTFPHRHLLEEMCHRHNQKRKAGQERGDLRHELCGSVFGCEFHGYQALGFVEGSVELLMVHAEWQPHCMIMCFEKEGHTGLGDEWEM